MPHTDFLVVYYSLNVALLLLVAVAFVQEYRIGSPMLFAWVTVLVIYVVPAFTDPFLEDATVELSNRHFNLVDNPLLFRTEAFALAFSALYVTMHFSLVKLTASSNRPILPHISQLSVSTVDYLLPVLAAASAAGTLLNVYSLFSAGAIDSLLDASFATAVFESDKLYARLAIYLFVSSSGGAIYAFMTGRRVYLLIFLVSAALYFMTSFSRTMVAYVAVPFVFLLIYRYRSVGHRMLFLSLLPLAYFSTVVLLLVRYAGSAGSFLTAVESGAFFQGFFENLMNSGGEAQLRFVYYFFMGGDWPSDQLWVGQNYVRLLMLPIPPEYSFGLKPELLDNVIFDIFFANNPYLAGFGREAALHALIFGDAYLGFGWAGVLMGAVWAMAAFFGVRIICARTPEIGLLMIAPMCVSAVKGARGAVFSAVAIVVASFALLLVYMMMARLFEQFVKAARSNAAAMGSPN